MTSSVLSPNIIYIIVPQVKTLECKKMFCIAFIGPEQTTPQQLKH